MRRSAMCAGLLCLVIAIAAGLIGCSDDPEKPPGGESPYGDLTDKEDCIGNLVVSYELRDIEHYQEILHPDYVWYGKKWGALGDDLDVLDYAEDVAGTELLFEHCVSLELEIDAGSWQAVDKIGEQPCTDCWETTRLYHFRFTLPGDDTIYISNGLVKFVIVPVDDGETTEYRIRIGYDIGY